MARAIRSPPRRFDSHAAAPYARHSGRSMAGRAVRGLELLRESWTLLREDKQLLLFPILSFAASAVVLASFLLPMAFHPGALGQALGGHAAHRPDRHVYLVLFAMYLASYSIPVFFNVGLASCALIRFPRG